MFNLEDNIKNYLTIDVEDYFQVSAFANIVEFEDWENYESRVVNATRNILSVLNDCGQVKATFFLLGWVAERYPELVKEIDTNGHEIACHSYRHKLIYNTTPDEFRRDVIKSKSILEDIIGKKVIGYRAPSYSITKKTLWAFEILKDIGFKYDSSIFPIRHDRYGIPDAPRFKHRLPQCDLVEYPISTSLILGIRLPVSGGGYFRLFPYSFTKRALNSINKKENRPFLFYLHPWEFDPKQPGINRYLFFPRLRHLRHYINLGKTVDRFVRLLHDFKFVPISDNLDI